jgi:hypothetical protein
MESEMSLDEARELAALTDRIVENLKFIEEHADSNEDFDDLEKQSSTVAQNLQFIEQADTSDLDDLQKQTSEIVGNLAFIKENQDLAVN